MPGYGLLAADEGRGLLPWTWAQQRLGTSRNYWLATVRPDGRPHVQAVWGVWLEDAFWFSTGAESRKARNLAASSSCVVATQDAEEPVVVEGNAAEVDPDDAVARAGDAYHAKYDPFRLDPSLGPIFRVRPSVAFGLVEHADEFAGSATRWTFR
jgi:Pyridoxamine 5'-phosphate oxidase